MKKSLIVALAITVAACQRFGADYDHAFAERFWEKYPNSSASASAQVDAAKLSVDQQYAIYRYGMENFHPPRMAYDPLVASGGRAVPLLRSKLRQSDDSWSIWTIAVVLDAMNHRTYNVAADQGLSDDLWAAAERAKGPYSDHIRRITQSIAPRS